MRVFCTKDWTGRSADFLLLEGLFFGGWEWDGRRERKETTERKTNKAARKNDKETTTDMSGAPATSFSF